MKAIVSVIFISAVLNLKAQSEKDVNQLKELTNSISLSINDKKPQLILDAFIHPSALIYSTFNGVSPALYSKEFNTAQGLSDFVKNSENRLNQVFSNIKVNFISEGRATVATDYFVKINNKKSHKGHEFYSAIKTTKGWKFVSLIFTTEPWKE